ncbi:MAG TPA: hypothetical protein VLZ05_17950 [Mycobacterium sp.]|nr:hypothetical protein [Mycobacterium sp.]HUH70572.1 hypothetical protein [Mycobacterium sp.]
MYWSVPGYALVLALLVVGPLLKPGYLLLRDAVSTPRSYLSDSALGLTSAPRATPQDFAVALASHLVDGGIVVKTLLVAGLWLAGWGAARLVATALPCAGAGGQLVAVTLAIWNPYVAERLLQGHWSLLLGYGCLPWVATAMLRLRLADGTCWFGVANCCRLGAFECTLACSSVGCRRAKIGRRHNLIPRDWPGYASCGPVGTTAPFVSSSSGSAGDGGPDQRIPLAWRASIRPTRGKRRPWAVTPEPKPRKGTPHESVAKTHSAATVFGLVFWMALAGLTPTGLLLAATVALVCVAAPGAGRPRWLCAAATLGAALVAALPWLTASAMGSLLTSHTAANALGVTAFAPRAEPGLGTLASLAGLGGIWNGEAVPSSRTTLFALSSAVVLLGVVVVGLPGVARRPAVVPLLALALVSVLVPAALATGPGLHVLRAVVDAVPGFGVLRDGQKWVALAVPGYTLAGADAVVTLRKWLRPAVSALVCCLALILALPDLAWGVWGKVSPVHYPPGWAAVAAAINANPRAVAVLPAGTMRRFSWSGAAPVLDPLPRWVRADVLTTGDLAISGVVVPGEGKQARAVQELLLAGPDPAALVPAGVGWLVVESDSAGDMGAAARTLAALTPVYRDDEIALYRIGGDAAGASPTRRQATVIAHLAWLAMLIVGAAGPVICRVRRHLTSCDDTPTKLAED